MKALKFYNRPFTEHSGWVYDAKNNFVFQFHPENNDQEQKDKVLFSLNSLDHEPLEELSLLVDDLSEIEILNGKKLFITIRGWGNLTGTGGFNFADGKASKIQDDFRNWILYKLKISAF